MRPYLISMLLIMVIVFTPLLSFGQNQQQQQLNPPQGMYQVIKTKNIEQFVLPYTASNHDRRDPMIYTYGNPKGQNWILLLRITYLMQLDKMQRPSLNYRSQ